MDKNELDPWVRQPDETTAAFLAFRTYRDLPANGRSLAKAVRALYPDGNQRAFNAKLRQWQKWSANYNWPSRVAAWEDEQDRVRRQAYLDEVEEMGKRHANVAMAMIGKAAQKLNSLDVKDITVGDMRAMFQEAVRLERLARGVPESNVSFTKHIDVTSLTDEELDAIRRS